MFYNGTYVSTGIARFTCIQIAGGGVVNRCSYLKLQTPISYAFRVRCAITFEALVLVLVLHGYYGCLFSLGAMSYSRYCTSYPRLL